MEYPFILDNCGYIEEGIEECHVLYYPDILDLSQNDYETLEGLRLQILNINLRNNYKV